LLFCEFLVLYLMIFHATRHLVVHKTINDGWYAQQCSYISLHQMTPLHWATYNQDANVVNDIMRYLVDHGADVNLKDDEGVSEF